MPKKINADEEPYIGLSKAMDQLRTEWPEAPIFALRESVVKGRIHSKRSSDKPGARYYVKMSDLRAACPARK